LIFTAKSLNDLPLIANQIISIVGERAIICFDAQMGSGKTTLIKHLIQILSTDKFTGSPTFTIANEYHSLKGDRISHLDLYRIEKKEELFDLNIDYYLDESKYCFIEWPEKSISFLPNDTFWVYIRIEEDQSRTIQIENDHKP
tara:strand:- start:754 stop:1182 length:429 start_codon:yes stop_codon:yes gene_type:complete